MEKESKEEARKRKEAEKQARIEEKARQKQEKQRSREDKAKAGQSAGPESIFEEMAEGEVAPVEIDEDELARQALARRA